MAVNGNGTSLGSAGSGGSGGSSQCVAAMHSFYAAINSGDSEALCALLAPNVEWDCFELPTSAQKAGVPWLRAVRGRAGVVQGHAAFESLLDVRAMAAGPGFTPKQIVAQGNTIFTISDTMIACKATGKVVRMEGAYLFQFNEAGLIQEFKHFVDTGAHVWVATADEGRAAAWAAMGRDAGSTGKVQSIEANSKGAA